MFSQYGKLGPLAAEIGLVVWGTAANFNGFCVLASLLQRRRSTEANQTLHDVWLLPGLVDYIYIFGGCCPVTEFSQVQNSLCVLQVLCCPIGSVTARQSSTGCEPNFVALSRVHHLYSAGRRYNPADATATPLSLTPVKSRGRFSKHPKFILGWIWDNDLSYEP